MLEIISVSHSKVNYKSNVKDEIDYGRKEGLLRGYNLEVTKGNMLDYSSCVYTAGEPEYVNRAIADNLEFLSDLGWSPTGRAVFRGYYREYYCGDIGEVCVERVEVKE